MAKVEWDYTEHARHYDARADYSREAIGKMLRATGCSSNSPVADIGAGTGKLTKELLSFGMEVMAVEPNDDMRAFGIKNTEGASVTWSDGTGENTGLGDRAVYAAFFGSSFNVVHQQNCLREVGRILVDGGWFGCMWNHRDLGDPVQRTLEDIIKAHIPNYGYGLRREDPSTAVEQSGLFSETTFVEGGIKWPMSHKDNITAWRSHATLRRQAGSDDNFARIVNEIEAFLNSQPDPLLVPYTTRIYFAQLKKAHPATS